MVPYSPDSSNNYFNSELASSECTLPEAYNFQAEVLRTGWIVGSLIAYQVRDSIGTGLLDDFWQYHPYLGSLQNSFNTLSSKATQLASCSSDPIFSATQRGWASLRESLRKEEVPPDLRTQLSLDFDLGVFSDTPLIVSDKGPDLPNVITPKEFEYLQGLYTAIEKGDSGLIMMPGSKLQFREQTLSNLRIILSTQVGRDLIYALHRKDVVIPIMQQKPSAYMREKMFPPETKFLFHGKDFSYRRPLGIVLSNNKDTNLRFYGAPGFDKSEVLDLKYDTLFHELTHAYHDLVTNDLDFYLEQKRYRDNPWTNEEEKRTILKTNEFRRQLKIGEKDWPGRWGHGGSELLNDSGIDVKLINLLAHKIRLDDQTPASVSIQQVLNNHEITGFPFCIDEISPEIFRTAFLAASFHGDTNIAHFINSERFKEIPYSCLSEALYKCASHGYTNNIQMLISSGRFGEIPLVDLVKAIYISYENANKSISQMLTNSKIFREISPEDLGNTLHALSSGGNIGMIQMFINFEKFSEIPDLYLRDAITEASRSGHPDIAQMVLDQLPWIKKMQYHLGIL